MNDFIVGNNALGTPSYVHSTLLVTSNTRIEGKNERAFHDTAQIRGIPKPPSQ